MQSGEWTSGALSDLCRLSVYNISTCVYAVCVSLHSARVQCAHFCIDRGGRRGGVNVGSDQRVDGQFARTLLRCLRSTLPCPPGCASKFSHSHVSYPMPLSQSLIASFPLFLPPFSRWHARVFPCAHALSMGVNLPESRERRPRSVHESTWHRELLA